MGLRGWSGFGLRERGGVGLLEFWFGRRIGFCWVSLVQWVLEAGSGGVQVLVRLGFAEGRMWSGLGS